MSEQLEGDLRYRKFEGKLTIQEESTGIVMGSHTLKQG